jgi:integrase
MVQEQLGHSNPTTALATYTHAIPESRKVAISQLAEQLFPNCGPVVPKFLRKIGTAFL